MHLQVGRRPDPLADAAVAVAVRQAVGPPIALRADANRCWTLQQAAAFADGAAAASLEVCCYGRPVALPGSLMYIALQG